MTKKKSLPQGTTAMFLETDLQKTGNVEEQNFTPLQKQHFDAMRPEMQEKIREGYGTVILDLESKRRICEFNMENYQPPQEAIESFARSLLPAMREFFSKEENRRKLEEYMENEKQSD